MGYLLRANTSYKHLAKKSERAVLTGVGRDGSEMAVSLRRFFARYRFLASENGLYELVSTFCHVAPVHVFGHGTHCQVERSIPRIVVKTFGFWFPEAVKTFFFWRACLRPDFVLHIFWAFSKFSQLSWT